MDNNNNITGFKDARVDELLGVYDKEFSQAKRAEIIREIDGILAREHHYVLGWSAPFHRIAFWNRFGMPEGILTRTNDYTSLLSLWWYDPEKAALIDRSATDPSIKFPAMPLENRYWQEYAKRQTAAAPTN